MKMSEILPSLAMNMEVQDFIELMEENPEVVLEVASDDEKTARLMAGSLSRNISHAIPSIKEFEKDAEYVKVYHEGRFVAVFEKQENVYQLMKSI